MLSRSISVWTFNGEQMFLQSVHFCRIIAMRWPHVQNVSVVIYMAFPFPLTSAS